jgi:hypothetical protein
VSYKPHNPLNPPYLKGETREEKTYLRGEWEGEAYLKGEIPSLKVREGQGEL